MVPHFFPTMQDKDIVDMDTKQRIRYMSESSMSGTSGYSTTSPGPGNSPNSSGYSPSQSPSSVLQSEFTNLTLPQTSVYQQQPPQFLQLQSNSINQPTLINQQCNNDMNIQYTFGGENVQNSSAMQVNYQQSSNAATYAALNREYPGKLRITEQPVEKFRFRYKSEMHGTHGSLNGTRSNRTAKTFPEVQLFDYIGPAIIRCSLFQTNRDSPHSHQLVVRKDDHDICDPHELKVSQEVGYFAEFKNMGIIHTAKKFIVEELLKKKRKRLHFELGRDDLTTKEDQELYKQTGKEAKDMNLNQVRLCFEAFRLEDNNLYTPIAAPVYSNPINNRKSAQTGELRITRLGFATGCVTGGEDLILLVEKVSKKNIKVRFFEMNDDELVWEAFATFRESDVHHQYAISCRIPPYKDKDIDKSVEVFIELVRPSDDERSFPPSSFRYKPREQVYLRKRKRTCSTVSGSSGSHSDSLSSGDIPKALLSEEIEKLLANPEFTQKYKEYSEEFSGEGINTLLLNLIENDTTMINEITNHTGKIERDGTPASATSDRLLHYKKMMISKKLMDNARQQHKNNPETFSTQSSPSSYMQRINEIYHATKNYPTDSEQFERASKQIAELYIEYSEKQGESVMHQFVINDNIKFAMPLCHILSYFKLENLFNRILNTRHQTALHCACLLHRSQYIRPLLNLGCNPNIQDVKGDTAMHIVVREANTECLECFINTNKDLELNILNYDGFTPLHLAIRDNNYEIASKLIMLDKTSVAVPNSTDGNNALHTAVQQHNLELIKVILESQPMISVINACNTAGHTPIDVAKQLASSNKRAGQILSLLLTFSNTSSSSLSTIPFNDLDDNCSNLVIKEEEQSSSSTEDDDDDDENSSEPAQNLDSRNDGTYPMDTQIKEEPNANTDDYFGPNDLQIALADKATFSKLCNAFDSSASWKHKLDIIPDFYKTDSAVMLNYVKRNVQNINCHTFALVIRDIDITLLDLFKK